MKIGDLVVATGFVFHDHGIGIIIGTQFGNSLSSAGDVNGDGFDDIIVGSMYFEGTSPTRS